MFKILLPYILRQLFDYVRNPNLDNREIVRIADKYNLDMSLVLKIIQTIAHHYGLPLVSFNERRNRPLDD